MVSHIRTFIINLIKSLKIISDDWSSRLFGIFMTQQCVEFNLTSVATSKYDCVIKTSEMFSFLPLIINSVNIGLSFS